MISWSLRMLAASSVTLAPRLNALWNWIMSSRGSWFIQAVGKTIWRTPWEQASTEECWQKRQRAWKEDEFDRMFFYLLHQYNRWLPKKNVEAGDEAKLARKRRVERYSLGLRWNVKGCLEVKVVFVVACHQETVWAGWRKREWTINKCPASFKRLCQLTWKPHWYWTASVRQGGMKRGQSSKGRAVGRPCWPPGRDCNGGPCSSTAEEPEQEKIWTRVTDGWTFTGVSKPPTSVLLCLRGSRQGFQLSCSGSGTVSR